MKSVGFLLIPFRSVFFVIFFILSLHSDSVDALSVLRNALTGSEPPSLLLTDIENKEATLARLEKQKDELVQKNIQHSNSLEKLGREIENNIRTTQQQIKQDPDNEFLSKQLSLFNERYRIVKKLRLLPEQIIDLISQQIKILKEYLKDPRFESKIDLFTGQDSFSFSDLRRLYRMVVDKKKEVSFIEEQIKIATTEHDNLKRSAGVTVERFEKRTRERAALLKKLENKYVGVNHIQEDQLWTIERELFSSKHELDELLIGESTLTIELNKPKLFINKFELTILEKTLREIKPRVRVSLVDISRAQEELEAKRQESYRKKQEYDFEIDQIDIEQKKEQNKITALSEQYDIPVTAKLGDWAEQPSNTLISYEALCKLGTASTKFSRLARQKEHLQALLAVEEEEIHYEEALVKAQDSFYNIQVHAFSSNDELAHEIRKYEQEIVSIKAIISSYRGKITSLEDRLVLLKNTLNNLSEFREKLKKQEKTLFKNEGELFKRCVKRLKTAGAHIQEELEFIQNSKNAYADALIKLDNTLKLTKFVESEFSSITMWHRPEHAVSWEGIRAAIPDIQIFIHDLRSYLVRTNINELLYAAQTIILQPLFMGLLFFMLLVLLSVRLYLPRLERSAAHTAEHYPSLRRLGRMFEMILGWFKQHFALISFALVSYVAAWWYIPKHSYVYVLACLIAIPYLIYLTSLLIRYFSQFNKKYEYIFLNHEFQPRWLLAFSMVAYATIAIVFFRRAFMAVDYGRSELPTVLLTVNFIILQVAIISLISKDLILSLIPRGGTLWEGLVRLLDHYYYLLFLLVITIVVLINPYVGFSQLVLYILKRVFYTVILVLILFWLHQLFKDFSSFLYFSSDNEVTKERFFYAKTWYGISVILLFGIFTFLGAIIIAKIWGWPSWLISIEGWQDVEKLLKTPLGEYNELSFWTLIVIFLYLLGGIVASFSFDRFVLRNIFDILLIDSGVQNAIASMFHYIILVTAIILGFSAVGLSSLIIWLVGALVVSIGFVIKDPMTDFVAYFIILVERPLKVGDFVQLGENIAGVVCKITPRSVVVRSKNSTTILLPNSKVIGDPIINWNYTRGFTAFDDIMISVPYDSDPEKVRTIIHQVLSNNQHILKNPRPIVRLDEFNNEGYRFAVRGYLSSSYTLEQWDIASNVRIAVVDAFAKNDIKLAVPIRRITFKQQTITGMYDEVTEGKKSSTKKQE